MRESFLARVFSSKSFLISRNLINLINLKRSLKSTGVMIKMIQLNG